MTHEFKSFLIPGMPLLLTPEKNENYRALNESMKEVANRIDDWKADRILYYSTAWLSVLGLSFQGRKEIKGKHVDENWHDLGDLDFEFHTDTEFTKSLQKKADELGFQTSWIDYDHFPIDTATIVADQLINPSKRPVAMVASHVYTDNSQTKKLAEDFRSCLSGVTGRTAVVGVSLLSTNFHTKSIDFAEDIEVNAPGGEWDQKLLSHFESSGLKGADSIVGEFVGATRTDMGLKALSFLEGFTQGSPAQVKKYGSLYGAGAAVVEF